MEERSSYKSASFQVATEALSCFLGTSLLSSQIAASGNQLQIRIRFRVLLSLFRWLRSSFSLLAVPTRRIRPSGHRKTRRVTMQRTRRKRFFRSHPTLLQLNNGFSLMSRARHLTFALEVSISLGVYTREPVPARNQYIHYRTLRN